MADYISNYTGQEIDAAVGKASNLPNFAVADANKVLTVNSTGNGLKFTTPASGGGGGVDLSDLDTVYYPDNLSRSFLIKYSDKTNHEDVIGWTDGFVPNGGSGEFGKFLMIWNSEGDSNSEYYTILEDFYDSSVLPNAPLLIKEESNGNEVTRKIDYGTPDMFVPNVAASDNGKVLAVTSHDDEYHNTSYTPTWVTINGVPNFSASDVGKALMVNQQGTGQNVTYSVGWSNIETIPTPVGCGEYFVMSAGAGLSLENPYDYILDILKESWGTLENEDKFLSIAPCSCGGGHPYLTWATITEGTELPSYDNYDIGKFLSIAASSSTSNPPILTWSDTLDKDIFTSSLFNISMTSFDPDNNKTLTVNTSDGVVYLEDRFPNLSDNDSNNVYVLTNRAGTIDCELLSSL